MAPDLWLALLAAAASFGAITALYVPIVRGGTIKNASLTRRQWTIVIGFLAAAARLILIALIG